MLLFFVSPPPPALHERYDLFTKVRQPETPVILSVSDRRSTQILLSTYLMQQSFSGLLVISEIPFSQFCRAYTSRIR